MNDDVIPPVPPKKRTPKKTATKVSVAKIPRVKAVKKKEVAPDQPAVEQVAEPVVKPVIRRPRTKKVSPEVEHISPPASQSPPTHVAGTAAAEHRPQPQPAHGVPSEAPSQVAEETPKLAGTGGPIGPQQPVVTRREEVRKEGHDLSQQSSDFSRREFRHGRRRGRRRFGRDRFEDRQPPSDDVSRHASEDYDAPVEIDPNHPPVLSEGILEISGKGFGFLREAKRNFQQSPQDVFVSPETVRRYGLRDGLMIGGEVRRGGRGPQLTQLLTINGEPPEKYVNLPMFEELTTINPIERIVLETEPDRFTTRIIDMMTPVGKGQRGLIVAPPRTGKTTLLEHIAEAVGKNHPKMKLIILLVDERPEEVTAIRRTVPNAELMASSNDSDVKNHTRIAQLAIDRAKRLVEAGEDVFILLDSLTRVGRAFNNATAGNGRTMSGGMDARGMEIPRRLFAAARNTEEAGSLTIIATALIETGSRMDDLIFQEFKGTGNMEIVLDRKISDQRIYPAIDIYLSGTRREELLIPVDQLEKISVIRRGLSGHKPIEAVERLLSFLKKFPTNQKMLEEIPLG